MLLIYVAELDSVEQIRVCLCGRTVDKTKWSRAVSILFFLLGLAVHLLHTPMSVWLILLACRMRFLFHFFTLANMGCFSDLPAATATLIGNLDLCSVHHAFYFYFFNLQSSLLS